MYAVGEEKGKGSERPKAPTLYGDPKTLLASGSGITPTIADNIIVDDWRNVKHSRSDYDSTRTGVHRYVCIRDQEAQGGNGPALPAWFSGLGLFAISS